MALAKRYDRIIQLMTTEDSLSKGLNQRAAFDYPPKCARNPRTDQNHVLPLPVAQAVQLAIFTPQHHILSLPVAQAVQLAIFTPQPGQVELHEARKKTG